MLDHFLAVRVLLSKLCSNVCQYSRSIECAIACRRTLLCGGLDAVLSFFRLHELESERLFQKLDGAFPVLNAEHAQGCHDIVVVDSNFSMAGREQLQTCLVIRTDAAHDFFPVRESGQGAACANDVFNRCQVLAFCDGTSAAWAINISDLAGMTFHSFHDCFFCQYLDHFDFIFVLRDRPVSFECLVRIKTRLRSLCAEFFVTDGFDDLHAVDIYAQVAFYRTLGHWFWRGEDACNVIGFAAYGMHVGGRTANVDNHDFADALVQKLRTLHDGAWCRNDRSVDHVTHMLHARCVGDVVFERVLDNLAAWLNIHIVDTRVNVFYII